MMSRLRKVKLPLPNPHPGEILMADFLKPMTLSQTAWQMRSPDRRQAQGDQAEGGVS
jgi:hypothetical protein